MVVILESGRPERIWRQDLAEAAWRLRESPPDSYSTWFIERFILERENLKKTPEEIHEKTHEKIRKEIS